MSDVPSVTLNDGNDIPQLGFGTYQIEPENTTEAVSQALEVGYRHIDTAQMYQNEAQVGAAIRNSGLSREEVFVTSKLDNGFHEPDDARAAFSDTLEALGTDYVDLFLIHWPLPTRYDGDFVSTWETLEEFKRDGRARSIGLSNFQIDHLKQILDQTDTVPAVDQIESHPYFNNDAVRAFARERDIDVEAWSPIAQAQVLDDDTIVEIADKADRTPAQVVLRWQLQRGNIIFPKTVTPERMKENFALFDFALERADMDRITALDRGEDGRNGPNPDTFDLIS